MGTPNITTQSIQEALDTIETQKPELKTIINDCRTAAEELGVGLGDVEAVQAAQTDRRVFILKVLQALTVSSPEYVGSCLHGTTAHTGIRGKSKATAAVKASAAPESFKDGFNALFKANVPKDRAANPDFDGVFLLQEELNHRLKCGGH